MVAQVAYVPGISPVNAEMERGGLKWVGIGLEEGASSRRSPIPTGTSSKKEKLLARDPKGFAELKPDEDPHRLDAFLAP
jgi:hypothetical protein